MKGSKDPARVTRLVVQVLDRRRVFAKDGLRHPLAIGPRQLLLQRLDLEHTSSHFDEQLKTGGMPQSTIVVISMNG